MSTSNPPRTPKTPSSTSSTSSTSATKATTTSEPRDLAHLSVDELFEKRGAMAYAAQMCALESLAQPDGLDDDVRALEDELRRRGVDPSGRAVDLQRG